MVNFGYRIGVTEGGSMANRICIISYCDECPHFDNEYYGYNETCVKLSRKISKNGQYRYEIPDDCPLTLEVASSSKSSSGWMDYDTSKGHCGLCGSLFCSGNCFK